MKFTEDSIFSLVITIIMATFVILSLQLGPVARTIPLLVGVPTLILVITQFFADVMHHWTKKIKKYTGGKILRDQEERAKTIVKDSTETSNKPLKKEEGKDIRTKELKMFSWILSLFALIYFIGYLIAVPLFLMLYLKIYAKERWVISVGLTIIVYGAMYTLFIFFLQVPLWKGVLFGGVGF